MRKSIFESSLVAGMFVLMLATSQSVNAATMLKFLNHIPAIQFGAQSMPARDDTITYWISGDRARANVLADVPTVLDGKTDSLYMLYTKFKTYIVEYVGAKSDSTKTDSMKLFTEGLSELRPQVQAEVTITDSIKTINGFKCRKYFYSQKMPGIGMNLVTETWATEDIKVNFELLEKIMYGSMKKVPGSEKTLEQMRKIKGVQVLSVGKVEVKSEEFSIPQSETRTELLEVKEVEVPADWFDAPKDYEKYDAPWGQ